MLAQTLPPTEVVVSDDASTDGTVELARAVFDAHHRANPTVSIRLTVIENATALGVSKNFEQAVAACVGEYSALSDQDDVWHEDRLDVAIRALDGGPDLLVVFGGARMIDERGEALGPSLFASLELSRRMREAIHQGRVFDILLCRNLVAGATVAFRRALVESARPFPASWLHDEWLATVAAIAGRVDFVNGVLIDYRQHDGNEIGARSLSLLGKVKRVFEPGSARNERLLARAADLADRVARLPGAHGKHIVAAHEKLAHEQSRNSLPIRRLARVWPVVRELRTGRYRTFGRGGADAFRGILQSRATTRCAS